MRQYSAGQRLNPWPDHHSRPLPWGQTPTLSEPGPRRISRFWCCRQRRREDFLWLCGNFILWKRGRLVASSSILSARHCQHRCLTPAVITGTGLHQECLYKIVTSGTIWKYAWKLPIKIFEHADSAIYNQILSKLCLRQTHWDCYPRQARKRHQMWLYKTACPTTSHMRSWKHYFTKPWPCRMGWASDYWRGWIHTHQMLQYDKTLRNHKRRWYSCIYETQSVCYDPVEGWWSYIGNATPHKTASVTSDLRLLHPPPHPYYNVTVHTLQESFQTQNRNKFHNAMLKGDTVFNWNMMLDKFSESHVHASTLL